METDFTNPGSTSQQEDLRDIQERAARDRRRVSFNAAKISARTGSGDSKNRLRNYGRDDNKRHLSRDNNCSLKNGKGNSKEKDQECNQVRLEIEFVIDSNKDSF